MDFNIEIEKLEKEIMQMQQQMQLLENTRIELMNNIVKKIGAKEYLQKIKKEEDELKDKQNA